MKKFMLGLTLALGVAGAASAAPVYPVAALLADQNGTIVAPERSDPTAMFDGDMTTFYSLGLGGSVVLDFGKLVAAPGMIAEVTFRLAGYLERVIISVGLAADGPFTQVATLSNAAAQGGATVSFNSDPFRYVKLLDNSPVRAGRDGFDVAEISFSAVPLPAAGLLLGGALFGLGALRRRAKKA